MGKTVIHTYCYNYIRTHFIFCCAFFYIIAAAKIYLPKLKQYMNLLLAMPVPWCKWIGEDHTVCLLVMSLFYHFVLLRKVTIHGQQIVTEWYRHSCSIWFCCIHCIELYATGEIRMQEWAWLNSSGNETDAWKPNYTNWRVEDA